MYANGFFEQQRRSPASLAVVITLHAAALGGLILYGTTTFVRERDSNLTVFNVPRPVDPPPPVPQPPEPQTERQQHQSQ